MPFVTAPPYDDWADIEIVGRVYCIDGSCPWGSGYHDGIDYVSATNLVPFRSACDGVVTSVDSFITGAGNRQVNVLVLLSEQSSFGLVYAFEPMTPDAANQQIANIFVQVGQQLSAGDLIGNLVRAPALGSHVHWGVVANHTQVCPLPFLSDAVETDLLGLIHRDTPGGQICY
jgi:murein DD-endopeptidase MepM/ murein hydrolase activator NlpD